jgi:hypothetical protein
MATEKKRKLKERRTREAAFRWPPFGKEEVHDPGPQVGRHILIGVSRDHQAPDVLGGVVVLAERL